MPQSGREGQFLFLQAKCLKLQTFQAPKIINCLHRLFVCLIVVVIMLNLSQKMVKKHKCCSFYFYCQTYFVMLRHGCYIVTCNLFGDCRLLRPPYVKILAPPLAATMILTASGKPQTSRSSALHRHRISGPLWRTWWRSCMSVLSSRLHAETQMLIFTRPQPQVEATRTATVGMVVPCPLTWAKAALCLRWSICKECQQCLLVQLWGEKMTITMSWHDLFIMLDGI
jgi:hypothetical protein